MRANKTFITLMVSGTVKNGLPKHYREIALTLTSGSNLKIIQGHLKFLNWEFLFFSQKVRSTIRSDPY